jgi:uncharacterized protein (TIGR02246 family)
MLQEELRPVFDALNGRDPERLSSFFTEDARVVSERSNVYSGAAAIRSSLTRRFAAEPEMTIELTGEPHVRSVTDDVAVVECDFRTRQSSSALPVGRSISIVKRTGDGWRIHSHWLVPRD